MLRRSVRLWARPPPVIGSLPVRGSHIDDNPSIGAHQRWDTKELLMADFGWKRGQLPKFAATSPFHRQLIARRMVTELIRKDYLIVGGARAPALRILADHVVELAKAGDTDSRQHLAHFLHDPLMVDKAFDEYPRRFRDMTAKYCMITKMKTRRRADNVQLYFIEYKNRDMSDNHKGEDYSQGPERFFLPPRVLETEKGVQRPPHMQMAFDRWASKFKTEEFHHWWRMRHAKMRFWGIRNVPHPSDVDPLWSEKEEEEWHNEMLSSTGDIDEEIDLDSTELNVEGEGGATTTTNAAAAAPFATHTPEMPAPGSQGPQNAKRSF